MPKLKGDTGALRSMIAAQKADALAATQAAKLTLERERADRYYMGDMEADMPAEEGRSKAVSTDVSDVVEGMLPQLMDIMAGADEVVRFEPVGPNDEQAAQEETDYTNHVFMQMNDGFKVLYDFTKDGLLSKNGIVKVWWEVKEQEEKENYYGLSEDKFALLSQSVLMSDGALKIIAHSSKQDEGALAPLHDVTVLETKKASKACVLGVPPEEFGIERNARDIKTANYAFHEVVTKTRADLIGEGYDKDQINKLPEYTGLTNAETLTRDSVGEHASGGMSADNNAAQQVKVTEHYVRMDYEGNGKPLLYKVVTGGEDGEILTKDGEEDVVEYDSIPFASWTPVPIAHRFFGRSIADLVIPVQQQKTAIKRGMLDNIYLHNAPRPEISESHAGPNTLDDLLTVRQGAPIRTKQPGGLVWQVIPDITASLYPALQYIDGELETRTGLSKQAQGIDANALQNQTAQAVAQVFSASQMRLKLVARHLAEGVRDIMWLLHQTIRKYGEKDENAYFGGKLVTIDPRNWKSRDHLTINVALGNGSKAQQFAQTMAIANVQKEMLQGGKANLVDDAKLYNTAAELTRILGHKNPDRFFNDPEAKDPQTGQLLHPAPPPQPSEKVQVEQVKQQGKQQESQQQFALDQQKAQTDAAHQAAKAHADIVVASIKAALDEKLKLLDAFLKSQGLHQQMAHNQQQHHMNMAGEVMGLVHDHQTHEQKIELMRQKPEKADA